MSLRLAPLDGKLVVRYDPSVISAERVRVAIEDIIDRIDN